MANQRARKLRSTMTDSEHLLWRALRGWRLEGFKFRRQHAIGPYIADFVCVRRRLIIEADGGQHADSKTDEKRTAWLERAGWKVLRFWNNDILTNAEGVQERILETVQSRATTLTPAPRLQTRWCEILHFSKYTVPSPRRKRERE